MNKPVDSKYSVLVADDAPFIREIILNFLSVGTSFEVVAEAENGQEAVEKCMELKPDLVILDIVMPVMSGLDAIIKLRELEFTSPVLACSTNHTEYVVSQALSSGFNDFLQKPFQREALVKRLTSLIEKSK